MSGRTRRFQLSSLIALLLAPVAATATTVEHADQAHFAQAAGGVYVVTFDDVSGPIAADTYAAQGLRIESRAGHVVNLISVPVGFAGANNANSQPNVISQSITPSGGFNDIDDDIDFVFARPVRAAGLWVGNVGPGVVEVQFLDGGGRILAREVFGPTNPTLLGTPADGNNRMSPYEGLQAMTIWAAEQYDEQEQRGTLEAGKLADMVILDQNPLEVDKLAIKGIAVLETFKEGESIYRRDSK